jgi:hypothetical protein
MVTVIQFRWASKPDLAHSPSLTTPRCEVRQASGYFLTRLCCVAIVPAEDDVHRLRLLTNGHHQSEAIEAQVVLERKYTTMQQQRLSLTPSRKLFVLALQHDVAVFINTTNQ